MQIVLLIIIVFSLPVQHTPLEKLDRKHFAKGQRTQENNSSATLHQNGLMKEIAFLESKMQKMCELLDEVCSYFTITLGFSSLSEESLLLLYEGYCADKRKC